MGKPAATAACLREDLSFESITRSFLKDANKWRGGERGGEPGVQ